MIDTDLNAKCYFSKLTYKILFTLRRCASLMSFSVIFTFVNATNVAFLN